MPSEISYEGDDPVATITLRRPDALNALTHPMLAELGEAVTAAERDEGVVGIVVTGEGRGFCSGLGPSVLQATATTGSSGLLSVRKPVIAAQNGVAAGGGFVLAAVADLRFASNDVWFTTVFSKRGVIDFIDLEAERHLRIAASEDTAEAFKAFMEKRRPRFGGTA